MDVRERLVDLLKEMLPTVWYEDCEPNRHPNCDEIHCAECIAERLIAKGVTFYGGYGSAGKLILVEGHKAFRGTMRITPKAAVPAYDLHGDWLYKPETGCWHGMGGSFPEDICTIMEVMQ